VELPNAALSRVIVVAAEPRVTDVIYVTRLPPAGDDTQVDPLEVKTLPEVPGATVCGAEVPLPSRTLLAVSDVAPVPPLATGRVPVTPEARLMSSSVPPKVRLPELVTVPVRVRPLTVPVPLTLVTVPPVAGALETQFVPSEVSTFPEAPAAVRPVPPLAADSVPARVIVPDPVIGPPEVVSPVEPPETATLVTVPPASVEDSVVPEI
jgi:hypothetical protein